MICITSLVLLPHSTVKAQTRILVVPDQYQYIQKAIDNANAGDTVFVKDGIWNTSSDGLIIDKPIYLLGEDSQFTVLEPFPQYQGEHFYGSYAGIQVTSDNVTISGFTIQGRAENSTIGPVYSGILLQSSNVTIRNNIITSMGWFGVNIPSSSKNISIENNSIVGNGVSFDQTTGEQYFGGIYLASSSVTIHNNKITDNFGFGIGFDQSSNCTIYNNGILRNSVGIYLQNYHSTSEGSGKTYYNNFIDNHQSFSGNSTEFNLSWDNGKVGNYWSNYLTKYPNASVTDETGVWNTPYVISVNNTDHYPLVNRVDINLIAPTPIPNSFTIDSWFQPLIVAIAIIAVITLSLLLYRRHRKTANLKQ